MGHEKRCSITQLALGRELYLVIATLNLVELPYTVHHACSKQSSLAIEGGAPHCCTCRMTCFGLLICVLESRQSGRYYPRCFANVARPSRRGTSSLWSSIADIRSVMTTLSRGHREGRQRAVRAGELE